MRGVARGVLVAAGLLTATSCGGEPAPVVYPADCSGLSAHDTALCGELRFWEAHVDDYESREPTRELLTRLIEGFPADGARPDLGRLHFLRGGLTMELALEHGMTAADRIESVRADLRRAVELDPDEPKYPPWVDTIELVASFIRGDEAGFEAVVEGIDANVARYPVGNILSVSGTMSGFPMSTGLPQRAVEMLEAWECTEEWCMHNTERAPFSQPGLQVHFADAYARVGDRERALAHFRAALEAEGASEWPQRAQVEAAISDIDAYVERYTALGEDQPAITLVYANSMTGCRICHGTR